MTVYIIIGVFLYFKQNDFLYFPTPKIQSSYKEKIFVSENESIRATVLNVGRNKAIIYFGGNAENVDANAEQFSSIFKDYTIYLVKYRGYGMSSGQPTENGLYLDALKIYDTIKKQYKSISIIGRSLGTGVATYLASKRDVKKLVLITPFDSIESVAQERFPIYPMFLLLNDKYKSIDRVNQIKAKTLILIAQNDQIIKKSHTMHLIDKFPRSLLEYKIIENTNHNSISSSKQYYKWLQEFLDK
jgi:esterase/lipase